MATDEKEYVLGTHMDELDRLAFQHQVWREHAYRLWMRTLAPGQRILDLGAGPGFTTFDIASLVGPKGRVLAIDLSDRFLEHLQTQIQLLGLKHVETLTADVQALQLNEQWDGAYARWVFCFLPEPARAIQAIAAALRPGAVLAILDHLDFSAIEAIPRSGVFTRAMEAVARSWREAGGNCEVVTALVPLLNANGFRVREVQPVSQAGMSGSLIWEWADHFFRVQIPQITTRGLLSEADARVFMEEWNERSKDPGAVFISPAQASIIAERI